MEKTDSKFNVDSKTNADATNQETSNPNVNVTNNVNPLFKDQKRVIKRMIVMDTSKLKGLGIESTIKNAMSKLEKGKHKKHEKPTFKPSNAQSIHATPKVPDTVIKSEFESKNVSQKPADTVSRHHEPDKTFPKPSHLTTEHVAVQPNSKSSSHILHLIRPSIPSTTATVNNVVFQSAKSFTSSVPEMQKVVKITAVPAKSTDRVQPMFKPPTSTISNVKPQHSEPTQNSSENSKQCSSEIDESQTIKSPNNNPSMKSDSMATTLASDGKKIKILSDVSLNDTKAKLLEIDKLSSKNLKFTNVIKGTDNSSSKNALHVPESVPVKVETDKTSNSKFTNVIKGRDETPSRSTVFTSNATDQTAFPMCTTTSRPVKSEIKVISAKNLKLTNVIQGTDKSAFHNSTRPLSTTSISVKIEDSSKNLKYTKVIDGMDRSKFTTHYVTPIPTSSISVKTESETFSPKILNFSNVTTAKSSKSTVPNTDSANHTVRPSYTASKPSSAGVDNVPSKNLNFKTVNASKTAFQFSNSTSKPQHSSFVPVKIKIEEVKPIDSNLYNVKGTMEIPLQTAVKTSVFNVKPMMPTCSTSASVAEVATKQMSAMDENVEIRMPSKQKYLSKKDGCAMNKPTSINDTKLLQDVLWATNNPRTYARHNVKRLLSDKIIKKTRPQEDCVQNVQNEKTVEVKFPITTNKGESKCEVEVVRKETMPVECDLKSEHVMSVNKLESKHVCNQATPSISALQPQQSTDENKHSETVSKNDFHGFSLEEMNESASVLKQIKVILARKQQKRKVRPKKDSRTVGCDHWILNYETGVLEEQVDQDATTVLEHQDVLLTGDIDEKLPIHSNGDVSTPTKEITPTTQVLERTSNVSTQIHVNSSKISVNVGADDGIQIDNDVTMVFEQKNEPHTKEVDKKLPSYTNANAVDDSTLKKKTSPTGQVVESTSNVPELQSHINSNVCDNSQILSEIPVIEDADDEISDIDLVHRSKVKCTGNTITPAVKNRRAILKSVELHRKAFMPATTDDESELSLCVRPPRPKLRKSRQKQTVEQLKIQQNAHVSLLKRFTQTDLDYDNINDEALVYFIDGMMDRIEMLENQVKCCFNPQSRSEPNVQTISLSEQSVSTHIDSVTENNESVKPSETVTENYEIVKSSENVSNNVSLNCVVAGEPQSSHQPDPINAETAADGQSRIHEVTIQQDTFLVTEYSDQCDKINHQPLNVKLEKETSPTPSSSVIRSRLKKTTKPTIRKKRKRKSLLEMLAQHVDQDTLKSVIIAHAKQKCDFSSSPDSESENDSDERGEGVSDVVNKIFRTVCTIDLCDDDDETLHEDVLQYLNDDEENRIESVQSRVSASPTSDKNHERPNHLQPHELSEEKPRNVKTKSEARETLSIISEIADVATLSETSVRNLPACEEADSSSENIFLSSVHTTIISTEPKHVNSKQETKVEKVIEEEKDTQTLPAEPMERISENLFVSVGNISDAERAETQTNSIPHSPLAISIVETESNNPTTADDLDNQIEMSDVRIDTEMTPPSNDISKLDDVNDTPVTQEPEKAVLKLRPFEEISSRGKPNIAKNDTSTKTSNKLSFEETLTQSDTMTLDEKRKSKRKRKVPKSKSIDVTKTKVSENSIDANENNSQLHCMSIESETSSGIFVQTSDDIICSSAVSVNTDSPVAAIKIKIEKDSEEPNLECDRLTPIISNTIMNGISKPDRSRKRKSQATSTGDISGESSRKRPIFDYFDSPEILTTKRARKSKSYVDDDDVPSKTQPSNERTSKRKSNISKSKSYVDDEIRNEDLPSKTQPSIERTSKRKSNTSKSKSFVDDEIRNEDVPSETQPSYQRTSKRKSNISKSSARDVHPKLEAKVEKVTDEVKDTPADPIEQIAEPKVQKDVVKLPLAPIKSGRGIRPPELAPLNVADQYVCGNCKEEVVAKNWTKHIRSHYGLAWRVDVDPPIEMDNIHSMASKVVNFTKKANIRNLKCHKCDVEKKSALGYLSHVEVCGLTPEQIKSKLVKCDYCPSMIRSCSMKIHLTFCSGLKRLQQKEKESTAEDKSSEECYNDNGRAVRRSAQKAMSSFKDLGKPPEARIEDYVERVEKISNKQHRKWRQLLKENLKLECVRNGCPFTTEDMISMLNHFNTCVLIDGETFYCNRCEHGPDTRIVIEEHIKANHSLGIIEGIDDKDFSDSDDEAEVGEESSESEGESGDDESLEKDDEQYEDGYDDDDDDGWNSRGYKKKRHRDWSHNEVMLNSCLDRKVLSEHALLLKSYSGGSYFQPALEWTQDFRDKHFSSNNLLPFAKPNSFSVLSSSLTGSYIPRVPISNQYLVKEVRKYKKQYGSTEVGKSDQWKSLKRFEATKESDSIILFTGGPVLSMAWLPVPDDCLSQILAVCCRGDAEEDILLNNTQPTKCLIQIWNFDKLRNGQLRHAQAPNLLYSIAYDHGPVIQMEFCPSGGFTEDRLGLLAVSSFDGHVDILALPKNFTCDNSKIDNLVFTIQPSMTLCCEQGQSFNVLLTKLVWSQSKGHTKLAGGYSNGLVAIWNLKNLHLPHICNETDGIRILLPNDLFFAGNKTIRLLEFHHDENNEARWLIAGSHDRKVKFFDTHNVYLEISTTLAHSRIVAGCWPIHWSTFLIGIDNAYNLKVSGIVVKQPLDIGCRTGTFYSCIGSTCDISFNNWLNSYVFVTSYGDIHVGYVRQMISGFAETRRQRSILGYTDAVDINKSISKIEEGEAIVDNEPPALDEQQPSTSSTLTFEQTKDVSYPSTDGVIFCDFANPLPAVTPPSYDKIRAPPMNAYNMVKVNRILFNPNVSAYKLYALGYESGFVRIIQLMPK